MGGTQRTKETEEPRGGQDVQHRELYRKWEPKDIKKTVHVERDWTQGPDIGEDTRTTRAPTPRPRPGKKTKKTRTAFFTPKHVQLELRRVIAMNI